MNKNDTRLIRLYIREQIARNMSTLDTGPNTFDDFQDYETNIDHDIVNDTYTLTVHYKGDKISDRAVFTTYDEAHHHSRMIIDKHRVQVMNGETKEN